MDHLPVSPAGFVQLSLGHTLRDGKPRASTLPRSPPARISYRHASEVARLPWHHRDRFDRLLIAQASVENLPIVSVDTAFDDYAVTRLW